MPHSPLVFPLWTTCDSFQGLCFIELAANVLAVPLFWQQGDAEAWTAALPLASNEALTIAPITRAEQLLLHLRCALHAGCQVVWWNPRSDLAWPADDERESIEGLIGRLARWTAADAVAERN